MFMIVLTTYSESTVSKTNPYQTLSLVNNNEYIHIRYNIILYIQVLVLTTHVLILTH